MVWDHLMEHAFLEKVCVFSMEGLSNIEVSACLELDPTGSDYRGQDDLSVNKLLQIILDLPYFPVYMRCKMAVSKGFVR